MAFFGIGIGTTFLLALAAGPAIAAVSGVRTLFWLGAVSGVVAALVLRLMPPGVSQVTPVTRVPVRAALTPELLRLDSYIFTLHALLSASFVALPFLLRDQAGVLPSVQWKLYAGALVVSLAGTVPLILGDERRGKAYTVSIAILLIGAGQLLLAFGAFSALPVVLALALFFAGFNFLEAGLPARLSILADDRIRGASLGVFATAQYSGIFAGGLMGGWLLEMRAPADVFLVCAATTGAWLLWSLVPAVKR